MASGFRLLTYASAKGPRAGILVNGSVYDAAAVTGAATDETVLGILGDWDKAGQRLAKAASAPGNAVTAARILEPIRFPGAIYGAGANYTDHVVEMAKVQGVEPDPDPHTQGLKAWHFIKPSRSVVPHNAAVTLPRGAKKVDWEAELAVVIGRRAKDVSVAEAMKYVAGYTIANDLSARDLMTREPISIRSPFRFDWLGQKGFDGSCPLGPWIVPAEDIADPQNLAIELSVNGVVKQKSNSAQMIFNIAEQISHLSEKLTLYPGDVIMTGTPAGVGSGRGEFLKSGDRVDVRIEAIGELSVTIV